VNVQPADEPAGVDPTIVEFDDEDPSELPDRNGRQRG
jgi:hypothetical protein